MEKQVQRRQVDHELQARPGKDLKLPEAHWEFTLGVSGSRKTEGKACLQGSAC